jgi:hypothetical protein
MLLSALEERMEKSDQKMAALQSASSRHSKVHELTEEIASLGRDLSRKSESAIPQVNEVKRYGGDLRSVVEGLPSA